MAEGGRLEENPWKRALHTLASIVGFAVAVAILFYSWQLAWMITAGLAFHELGHVLVIWALGIDWEIGFSGLGAWTRTPIQARRRLNHFWNSVIHLAGPLFSLLLALLAILIQLLARPDEDYWLRLANFNALLAVLNLLPLGELSDGGKLVRRLFASVSAKVEEKMLFLVGLVPLLFAMIVLALRFDWHKVLALLVIVVWFVINIIVARRHDDPDEAYSPRAMSGRQAFGLLMIALAAFLAGIVVVLLTPFWLTEQHVMNMVAAFLGIAAFVVYYSPPAFQILFGVALVMIIYVAGRHVIAELRRRRDQTKHDSEGPA
jgi:hypothetical protein